MSSESLLQRVLIVEDDPLLRWAIQETVRDVGHRVVVVRDAASALRALRQASEPFDIVLISHPLPDSEAFCVLDYVLHEAPRTATVFMPVHGFREDIYEARRLGAAGVLTKPFDMSALHRAIFNAVGI